MTNRKLHMRFRFAPRPMPLNDFELLYVRIFGEFRVISHSWHLACNNGYTNEGSDSVVTH